MTEKKKWPGRKKAEVVAQKVLEDVDAKVALPEMVKEKVTFEDEGAAKDIVGKTLAGDDKSQADYLPGTRIRDMLALPERVWDDDRGEERVVTMPHEYHYCWVEGSDITRFKLMGYRLCLYRGGRGLQAGGFSGTYLYECDPAGHVRLGDVYLMYCPIRLFEALETEDRLEAERKGRIGESNFHNLGYRYNIRTFSEVDGVVQRN